MYLCFLKFAREGKDAFTSNLRPVAHTMGLQITWPQNHVILCMFPPSQRYGRQISIEAHDRTGEGSVLRHWHRSAGWIVCLFVCLSDFFQSNFALFNNIVFKSEYIDKWKTKHAQIKCKVMYIVPFTLWYEIFVELHIPLIRNNQILRSDFRLETADKQIYIYIYIFTTFYCLLSLVII